MKIHSRFAFEFLGLKVILLFVIAIGAGAKTLNGETLSIPRMNKKTAEKNVINENSSGTLRRNQAADNVPTEPGASSGKGVYVDASGERHPWEIDASRVLLWKRKPFIPFGTWFVSHYLETGGEKEWAEDMAALELLTNKGITDFYVGWANRSPDQYQRLIDWFEAHGCSYGIIPARYDWDPLQGYKMSPVKTRLADAVSQEIESGLDRMKLVGVAFVVTDVDGRVMESGSVSADENGKALIRVAAKERPDATVWYIRQIEVADAIGFDWWGGFERHRENVVEFLQKLKTGPGLRLIIDPFFNEEGFYWGTENVIPSSLAYRSAFAKWLTERYGAAENLNEAWSVKGAPVTSIEQAARLIPILVGAKLNSRGYLLDNETQTAFMIDLTESLALLDLLEARDVLYAELHCRIADAIKAEALDVPVIYKRVGWLWRGFINRSTSGGFDGLGLEVYKEGDGYYVPAATYLSELRQSRRPMWYITTETCHAREGGSVPGQVGYPDRETMFRDLDKQIEFGARGIYLFAAQPQNDRKIFEPQYDLLSVPEQYEWFAEYKRLRLASVSEWRRSTLPAWLSFPPHSVEFGASGGEDGDIPIDAWRAPDPNGVWVLPTYYCDVQADALFTSLPTLSLSRRYGGELNDAIRRSEGRVIYAGLRVDLGRVPLLDRFFTNRLIEEDGFTYQELSPTSDSVVLARTRSGEPWALRAGNLTILARKGLLKEWSAPSQALPADKPGTSLAIDPRNLVNW